MSNGPQNNQEVQTVSGSDDSQTESEDQSVELPPANDTETFTKGG